jgi:hypothetical protein
MTEIQLTRFFDKVTSTDDCWLWDGAKNSDGYGSMRIDGKTIEAHRLSYTYFNGPLVVGLEIDHLCRVRNCVNPNHLEQITKQENGYRGESPYAKKKRQTHCKHGHSFDEANTYYYRTVRKCRARIVASRKLIAK